MRIGLFCITITFEVFLPKSHLLMLDHQFVDNDGTLLIGSEPLVRLILVGDLDDDSGNLPVATTVLGTSQQSDHGVPQLCGYCVNWCSTRNIIRFLDMCITIAYIVYFPKFLGRVLLLHICVIMATVSGPQLSPLKRFNFEGLLTWSFHGLDSLSRCRTYSVGSF